MILTNFIKIIKIWGGKLKILKSCLFPPFYIINSEECLAWRHRSEKITEIKEVCSGTTFINRFTSLLPVTVITSWKISSLSIEVSFIHFIHSLAFAVSHENWHINNWGRKAEPDKEQWWNSKSRCVNISLVAVLLQRLSNLPKTVCCEWRRGISTIKKSASSAVFHKHVRVLHQAVHLRV